MDKLGIGTLCLVVTFLQFSKGQSPVFILSENLQQVVTSSTLEWVSPNHQQLKNWKEAVVGAYQRMQDELDEENSANSEVPGEPVYICRAKQNGIWVSGQLRPKNQKCIVSVRGVVDHSTRYEVLVNTENAARLSWVRRDKFTVDPQGAVTGGDEPFRTFIARRSANSHKKEGSLTHFLGKLNPTDNLGKYTVVDQNDQQLEFEDGEILVETEPISYEFTGIKIDYKRKSTNQKQMILGEITLKNENGNDDIERVDAVISYEYDYKLYWGHGHGLLTGLPLTINFQNGTKLDILWGISQTVEKVDTYPIESFLAPGTAVNVTLRGDYGEWDSPYTAVVKSLYGDDEKIDRLLKDSQRETTMRNVMPDFGPVYFLHNNSFVPTTTTTTTTTTEPTTTTRKIITTTDLVDPIIPPEVITVSESKDKWVPDNSESSGDQNSIMMDEGDAQFLENKNLKSNDKGSASSTTASLVICLVSVFCALT